MADTSAEPSAAERGPKPGPLVDSHTRGLFPALGIFIAIMLGLALWAALSRSGVYAYVEGQAIKKPMVDLEKELVLRHQRKLRPSPEQERSALNAAVYVAIERDLVAREARRLGMAPERERLVASRRQLIERIEGWGEAAEILRHFRVREEDLAAEIEKDVLTSMVRERIMAEVPEPGEEEARRYWSENIEAFREDEGTRVLILSIRKPDSPQGVSEALQRAEEARREVLAGGDFQAIASRLSEGPHRSGGGDMGFVRKGFLPRVMEDAIADLPLHQVSEIVETRDGFHFLMVAGRRKYGYTPFEEVRQPILMKMKVLERERRYARLVHRLRAAARIVRYDYMAAATSAR